MEEVTLLISLTCLWISDSEFRRDWKEDVIRGRSFPSFRFWLGG